MQCMYNNVFLVFGKKKKITEHCVHHGNYGGFKVWDSECCAREYLYSHIVIIALFKMPMSFDRGLIENSSI